MRLTYKTRLAIVLILVGLLINTTATASVVFRPSPIEDEVNGRNSYTYQPAINHPTLEEKEVFVNKIKDFAVIAGRRWGIPASVIMGMAIAESGYGFTRLAYNTNNIFGIKIWAVNPPDGWQLQGQPDEDGGNVRIIADYGNDRKVYDESSRRDNWYKVFASYEEAISYLAEKLLLNTRYRPARDSYLYRINNGWSYKDAAKQYVYDIGEAGYNQKKGQYYMTTVSQVMDSWNFYKYDNLEDPPTDVDENPWIGPINISSTSSDSKYVCGEVTITVTAGDDKGISRVEFYSDEGRTLIATVTSLPYSTKWATEWVANGEQILKVKAYDTIGQSAEATRTIYVSNSNPPTVGPIQVSPLAENNTVWGDVTVSVDASDDIGIQRVDFYSANGLYLIGSDFTAPYSVVWSTYPWVRNGEQTLKVVVYDTDGMTANSTRKINVANNLPPVLGKIQVSPVSADGYYVWRNVTISIMVSDPNGTDDIERVEFYSADGNYLIGKDYSAPYSVVWSTYPWVPNGPQTLRVKAVDKSGNTATVSRTVQVHNQ